MTNSDFPRRMWNVLRGAAERAVLGKSSSRENGTAPDGLERGLRESRSVKFAVLFPIL